MPGVEYTIMEEDPDGEWVRYEDARLRFAEGFKKGQLSVKRKNESGCVRIINDSDEIESLCGLHEELIDRYKLKSENVECNCAEKSLQAAAEGYKMFSA